MMKAITIVFRDILGIIVYFTADVLSSFRVLLTATWRTVGKIDSTIFTVVFRHGI